LVLQLLSSLAIYAIIMMLNAGQGSGVVMNSRKLFAQHNLSVIAWVLGSFVVSSVWHFGEYLRMLWTVNVKILWVAFIIAIDPDMAWRKGPKRYL
jgi:uncharacterized membrane protein